MFEAHVFCYIGLFRRPHAVVLEFRGLFRVLGSGLGFPQSDFRAIRGHLTIFRPVSCPWFGFGANLQPFQVFAACLGFRF